MAHPVQPSGVGGKVALEAATALSVGGLNQKRTSLTVANNGPEAIYLLWGDYAAAPDAATVKSDGLPIQSGGSVTFGATLQTTIGGNNPTLFGVTDSVDQTSPADTRWSEQG